MLRSEAVCRKCFERCISEYDSSFKNSFDHMMSIYQQDKDITFCFYWRNRKPFSPWELKRLYGNKPVSTCPYMLEHMVNKNVK